MTRYVTLAEYFWLAEQVTGTEAAVLIKASRVDLADSALHAPAAGFGEEEFYPELLDKAAVLACRLSWNHPLPDGNERASWAALVMFLDIRATTIRNRGQSVGYHANTDVPRSTDGVISVSLGVTIAHCASLGVPRSCGRAISEPLSLR